MSLELILTIIAIIIGSAIIYFIFLEIKEHKEVKKNLSRFETYQECNIQKNISKNNDNNFDKFVNNEMSFEEIKNHAINMKQIEKELFSKDGKIIEVDFVTASQILKNWNSKVLISEDNKIVLTNEKNISKQNIIIEEKEQSIKQQIKNDLFDTSNIKNISEISQEETANNEEIIVAKENEKNQNIIDSHNVIISNKTDELFEQILETNSIKFEEDFYDYILKNKFSSYEETINFFKSIIEKNIVEIHRIKNDIFIESKIFFEALIEIVNEDKNTKVLSKSFLNEYKANYSNDFKSNCKINFIKQINTIADELIFINDKNRFTTYSLFVLKENTLNEVLHDGQFLKLKSEEFESFNFNVVDVYIPNFGNAQRYKNKKEEALSKKEEVSEPIF